MLCAPAKPVRACILRQSCPVSHVTFEAPLSTSHFSLHSSHSTLHTPRSTLHTSHCTLRTPHCTSHCTLRTPHFTLHSPHFTLHSPHFSLLTAFFTLHTSHFTLHTSHFTLIPAHLFSSLLICHLSFHESLPSTTSRTCMRRAPARPVRACFVRSCCTDVAQEHDLTLQAALFTLHTCTSHSTLHLISNHVSSSHLISALLISSHLFSHLI